MYRKKVKNTLSRSDGRNIYPHVTPLSFTKREKIMARFQKDEEVVVDEKFRKRLAGNIKRNRKILERLAEK